MQFRLRDLVFAIVAAAIGCFSAVHSTWDVGILVGTLLIVLWQVRDRRYAAIPGAAVGVLFVWLILPVSVDAPQLLSLTTIGATIGASLNAVIYRFYLTGLLALLIVVTVAFVVPLVAL